MRSHLTRFSRTPCTPRLCAKWHHVCQTSPSALLNPHGLRWHLLPSPPASPPPRSAQQPEEPSHSLSRVTGLLRSKPPVAPIQAEKKPKPSQQARGPAGPLPASASASTLRALPRCPLSSSCWLLGPQCPQSRHSPGPLPWLPPLPGMLFPQGPSRLTHPPSLECPLLRRVPLTSPFKNEVQTLPRIPEDANAAFCFFITERKTILFWEHREVITSDEEGLRDISEKGH